MSRLDDIRRRREALGPDVQWIHHAYGTAGMEEPSNIVIQQGGRFSHAGVAQGDFIAITPEADAQENDNARFIANAPTDVATLLEIVDKVQEELLKRAKALQATSDRLREEVMNGDPDRDPASAARYAAFAAEADASYGLVRRIVEGQW